MMEAENNLKSLRFFSFAYGAHIHYFLVAQNMTDIAEKFLFEGDIQ